MPFGTSNLGVTVPSPSADVGTTQLTSILDTLSILVAAQSLASTDYAYAVLNAAIDFDLFDRADESTLTGWTDNDGSGASSVVSSNVLVQTHGTGAADIQKSCSDNTYLAVRMKMTGSNKEGVLYLRDSTTNLTGIRLGNDGSDQNVYYFSTSGTWTDTTVDYVSGTYLLIEFKNIDTSAGTFDLVIDGTSIGTSLSMNATGSADNIRLLTGSSGAVMTTDFILFGSPDSLPNDVATTLDTLSPTVGSFELIPLLALDNDDMTYDLTDGSGTMTAQSVNTLIDTTLSSNPTSITINSNTSFCYGWVLFVFE